MPLHSRDQRASRQVEEPMTIVDGNHRHAAAAR
jgi:hypothetical protein